MASATIKKPIIGRFARTLDISQAEIGQMRLSDTCVTQFDIMELGGSVRGYSFTGSTTVTATGSKTAAYVVPPGKRWRLHAVAVNGSTGVWTTNDVRMGISSTVNPGVPQYFTYDAIDILTRPATAQLTQPIYLQPGDYIWAVVNVNSYTSGTGLILIGIIVTEWDV